MKSSQTRLDLAELGAIENTRVLRVHGVKHDPRAPRTTDEQIIHRGDLRFVLLRKSLFGLGSLNFLPRVVLLERDC